MVQSDKWVRKAAIEVLSKRRGGQNGMNQKDRVSIQKVPNSVFDFLLEYCSPHQ